MFGRHFPSTEEDERKITQTKNPYSLSFIKF